MVVKQTTTGIKTHCRISMPRHGPTLIDIQCITVCAIRNNNSLICVGLKFKHSKKNHPSTYFNFELTLSALKPYSATLFHSVTNSHLPLKFVAVCWRMNLLTVDRSSVFLSCISYDIWPEGRGSWSAQNGAAR